MVKARGQAEAYAKALPAGEGWPPFLIVVDVGHSIELYSEFTRQGKTYIPFPDPQSFRIKLADVAKPEIRQRLVAVWVDPLSLAPSKKSAKVTRELASRLAELAKLLERDNHDPARVARFLMRCLFTMFAEDVELIPKDSFKTLLHELEETPENFQPMVAALWQTMDTGGFSTILRKHVARFNGGLFAEHDALNLSRPMLKLLRQASESFWADVEPAIFGTLLERALDPIERHKLGAHYTPRAYVERLVMQAFIGTAPWDHRPLIEVLVGQVVDRFGPGQLVHLRYRCGWRESPALSRCPLLQTLKRDTEIVPRMPPELHAEVLARIGAIPGVVSVSASNQGVLNGSDLSNIGTGTGLRIEGEPPAATGLPGLRSFVAPGFFRTIGIPIVAGRDFTEQDIATTPRGVVISQAMARHYFQDRDAVGRRIWFPEDTSAPTTVIGVVGDFLIGGPRETSRRPGYTRWIRPSRARA
jgi:hypothetical protein